MAINACLCIACARGLVWLYRWPLDYTLLKPFKDVPGRYLISDW